MNSKVCAGCEKYLSGAVTRFRGKTFCGDEDCKKIIDKRRSEANRRKKIKRKKQGIVYRGVNSNVRRKIVSRDEGKCALCGSEVDVQVHHIVPSSEGGTDSFENLICLCDKDHTKVHLNLSKYTDRLSKIAKGREDARRR